MAILSLFGWWYSQGFKSAVIHAGERISKTFQLFAIPILLRTLFAPWRRIVTAPGAGLDAHIRAAIDNMVSRVIGFLVRILVLVAAVLLLFLASIASLLEILSWPLIPIIGPLLIIKGLLS